MATLNLTATNQGREDSVGTVSTSFNNTNVIDATNEWLAFRFSGFAEIPAGSTINSAVLTVTVGSGGNDEPNHPIRFERNQTPADITAGAGNTDISERTYTTASVTWSSTDLGAGTGTDHSTPDLSAPLQEVIDNHAPVTVLFLSIQGSSDASRDLALVSTGTKTLDIDYTPPVSSLIQDIIGGFGLIPFAR